MQKAKKYPEYIYCIRNLVLCLGMWIFLLSVLSAATEANARLGLRASVLSPGDVGWVSLSFVPGVVSAALIWKEERIVLTRFEKFELFGAFFAISHREEPGEKALDVEYLKEDGKTGRQKTIFKVVPREFPVQRLTLPEEKVSLSKKDLARHWREKAAIKKALAHPLDRRVWEKSFQRPVGGLVSTPFGVRRILNGKPRSFHSGIDLHGVRGEPVVAASDGVVILTGTYFFAGNSVYIDHGMGLVTMYFHLSEIKVKQGEPVHAGQTVGLLGSTGRSTGPHLHWGLRVHNRPADPLSLLALFPLP